MDDSAIDVSNRLHRGMCTLGVQGYGYTKTDDNVAPERKDMTSARTERWDQAPTLPSSSDGPLPQLGRRYLLQDRMASGAMGDVWSAEDQLLKRKVAVKIAKAPYRDDATFRQRFRLEAQSAAGLSHPGIASVFDYGEEMGANGEHFAYIVMELVDGESLNQLLHRVGVLEVDQALQVMVEVAEALQVAHDQGIVHRDIKPANILIRSDGRTKITDFGIARAADAGALTQTGTMLGTVEYMAPEQLKGQTATGAADMYALGVVTYLCLSGRTPFPHAEPMTVAMSHLNDEVPPLPSTVPQGVRDLVMQMLAKDPGARPASCAAVAIRATALRDTLSLLMPEAAPTTTMGRPSSAPDTAVSGAEMGHGQVSGATAILPMSKSRPRMADHRTRWNARTARFAAIVALLLIAFILILWPSGTSKIRIPRVTGLSASTATAHLKAVGLRSRVIQVDSTQASGTVLSQHPSVGIMVPNGQRVDLTTSNGKVEVDATSLVGQPYATASATLSHLGLIPNESTVTSTAPPGSVVSVSPSGQVPVGTAITVGVAAAPPPTPVTAPAGGGPGHGHGKGKNH